MSIFTKAKRERLKLRMAIFGPSGSGKTYTSLNIAQHLAGGKVAVLDTERGSASKYSDLFDFDVAEMKPPFSPERYIKVIGSVGEEYDTLIVDSLSHAWSGPGGLLEIVDDIQKRMKTNNGMLAWKEATPLQNKLYDEILGCRAHIICTMRSKQAYEVSKDDQGKVKVAKVGLQPVQKEGTSYEFDIAAEMDLEHNMLIEKTRCHALRSGVFKFPGEDVARIISKWLNEGGKSHGADDPAQSEPNQSSK